MRLQDVRGHRVVRGYVVEQQGRLWLVPVARDGHIGSLPLLIEEASVGIMLNWSSEGWRGKPAIREARETRHWMWLSRKGGHLFHRGGHARRWKGWIGTLIGRRR